MSSEAIGATFKTKFNHPSARLVLLSLADHHNRSTGKCFPKIKTIMDDACLSRSTVFRCLFWLEGIPDPKDASREVSPVRLISRKDGYDKNGRQTSSEFVLLFVEGCQVDTPGSQYDTGESVTDDTLGGVNHDTPLKKPRRRTSKKEENILDEPKTARPSRSQKLKTNRVDDEQSGYLAFCDKFKATLRGAGRKGEVGGLSNGRKVWATLNQVERNERYSALAGYEKDLKAKISKNPQHISTFLGGGWEDFAKKDTSSNPSTSEPKKWPDCDLEAALEYARKPDQRGISPQTRSIFAGISQIPRDLWDYVTKIVASENAPLTAAA